MLKILFIGSELAKRLLDIAIATAILALMLLVFVLVAIAVKLSSPGPVFFRQTRAGRHKRPFRIFKFRTMFADADLLGRETAGVSDPRITRVGRLLRKTKLDELPQLLNVLTGDMSLVGPRPEIPFYADRYVGEELLVFSIRPGVTDECSLELADLDDRMDERGDLTPAEYYEKIVQPRKKKLQLHYVRTRSFIGDLAILWRTFWRVLRRGISR